MHFSVHELNIRKAIQTSHLKLRCNTANTYQFESMDNFNLLQSNSLINVRISSCGFSSFAERTQTILYVCCRDGKNRENKWGRKMSSTQQKTESCKTNSGFCTLQMTMTKDLVTGKVKVEYISTHSGHQPCRVELRFLPLPQSLHKEVKEKFAQGITIEKIMDGKFMSVAHKNLIIMLYLHIHFRYQSWSCKTHYLHDLQRHNRAETLCDTPRSSEHHQTN